jgi:hypothetical protein
MAEFSPRALSVIGAFAVDVGLPAPSRADEPVSFVFSHWGTLTLLMSDDGTSVLVALERAPYLAQTARERRLLQRAGFDAAHGWFLHSGMAEDGAMFCFISIDQDRFDTVSLDAALNHLVSALDAID